MRKESYIMPRDRRLIKRDTLPRGWPKGLYDQVKDPRLSQFASKAMFNMIYNFHG